MLREKGNRAVSDAIRRAGDLAITFAINRETIDAMSAAAWPLRGRRSVLVIGLIRRLRPDAALWIEIRLRTENLAEPGTYQQLQARMAFAARRFGWAVEHRTRAEQFFVRQPAVALLSG